MLNEDDHEDGYWDKRIAAAIRADLVRDQPDPTSNQARQVHAINKGMKAESWAELEDEYADPEP